MKKEAEAEEEAGEKRKGVTLVELKSSERRKKWGREKKS